MWDADEYEIKALVKKDNRPVKEIPLTFAGQPSLFAGTLKAGEKGVYELLVYAYHKGNGNTGIDRATFEIK